MIDQIDRHTMTHVATLANGAQRFRCDVCGRQFLLQWPPHYKRVIEVEGDATAVHTGSSAAAMTQQERDAGELPPAVPEAPPYWIELED